MGEIVKGKELNDTINVQQLIDFLEYEEALTKDKETSQRIRILLKLLGVWS